MQLVTSGKLALTKIALAAGCLFMLPAGCGGEDDGGVYRDEVVQDDDGNVQNGGKADDPNPACTTPESCCGNLDEQLKPTCLEDIARDNDSNNPRQIP